MFISDSKTILNSQRGMSLVEILIALTLLAVAGTFVTLNVLENLDEGNIKAAKIQITNFKGILKDYRRKCNSYPTTDQGLDALIEKPTSGKECARWTPFLDGDSIPRDPWDGEYDYESDGKDYTITSYGSDGVEGGEGVEADISNKDSQRDQSE
jgi:general secretion pathway protein G